MVVPDGNQLLAKLFRGFAEPARLALLVALVERPRTVTELVDITAFGQPNVSAHLACLKDCGLVQSQREGRYVRYSITDARVARLLTLGQEALAGIAQHIYDCTRIPTPTSKGNQPRQTPGSAWGS